jgi:hypothetical protein
MDLKSEKRASYFEGMRSGIILYAWWKNGKQFVGTGKKTLNQAIKENYQWEKREIKFELKEVKNDEN